MDNTTNNSFPEASVMIITRNRPVELSRCLNSIKDLRYRGKIEVVVLDDAGDFDSTALAKEIIPDCVCVKLPMQMGPCLAKNIAIANCSGKYVYCLDDDGWLEQDALLEAVNRAESNSDYAVVVSVIHQLKNGELEFTFPENQEKMCYLRSFPGGACLFRKESFVKAGWYPDDFVRQADEEDVAVRILDNNEYIVLEPRSIMYHQPSSIGRNKSQIAHYALRNSNRSAMRLYPWPYNVIRIGSNFLHSIRFVFTRKMYTLPIMLLGDMFAELIIRKKHKRGPVRLETIRKFMGRIPIEYK